MKKVLYGLLLAALVIGVGQAAQNLRQNSDGTADWVGSKFDATPLGVQLPLFIANTIAGATSTTYQLISPITNALIKDVIVTKQGAGGGTAVVTITVNPGTAPSLTTPMRITSSHGTSHAVINIGAAANVSNYAITQPNTLPNGSFLNNAVQKGDVILVNVAGGTTAATAYLILSLQPR